MLNISFEFRKGIFFLRLIGTLNKQTYETRYEELKELLIDNDFKYIVLNTNYLNDIDLDGINYITKIYYMITSNNNNMIICDKYKVFDRLFNKSIPNISDEIEIL